MEYMIQAQPQNSHLIGLVILMWHMSGIALYWKLGPDGMIQTIDKTDLKHIVGFQLGGVGLKLGDLHHFKI